MPDGLAPPYNQSPWVRDYTVPPVLIRTETRNDAVGNYSASIYSDGHVETDPVGRPIYKEDLQRITLAAQAVNNGPGFLKIARNAEAQPERPQLQADGRHASNSRVMCPAFYDTLATTAGLTDTFTASPAYRETLVGSVDLGGMVVGARAGMRPEYGGVLVIDEDEMNDPTGLR